MILTLVHSTRLLPCVVKITSVPRTASRAIPPTPLDVHRKSTEIDLKAERLPELRWPCSYPFDLIYPLYPCYPLNPFVTCRSSNPTKGTPKTYVGNLRFLRREFFQPKRDVSQLTKELCQKFAQIRGRAGNSPAPKASGWPRPKAEPRSGRKSPSAKTSASLR